MEHVTLSLGMPVVVEGHVYEYGGAAPRDPSLPARPNVVQLLRPGGLNKGATPGKRVLCNVHDLRVAHGGGELEALIKAEVTALVNTTLVTQRGITPERMKQIARIAAARVAHKLKNLPGPIAFLPGRLLPAPTPVAGDDLQVAAFFDYMLDPRRGG